MRMSKAVLQEKVNYLNRLVGAENGQPNSFELNYAYGGVRLCKRLELGGQTEISSRTNLATMAEILDTVENTILKMNLIVK